MHFRLASGDSVYNTKARGRPVGSTDLCLARLKTIYQYIYSSDKAYRAFIEAFLHELKTRLFGGVRTKGATIELPGFWDNIQIFLFKDIESRGDWACAKGVANPYGK